MTETDEELAIYSKSGDNASFQELMRRFLKPVFNFVLTYVKFPEEAEDITQDTFFKAWRHLKKFNDSKMWKPWIFTIARNTALDYIKKKKAIPFSAMDGDDELFLFSETIEDTEALADELFESAENVAELGVALSTLRTEYQSVIMLHYQEELTFEEISSIMNAPMNTVKSWHRRALENIKTELDVRSAQNDAPEQLS